VAILSIFFGFSLGLVTLVFQDATNLPQQRGRTKRLFEVGEPWFEHPVPDHGVIRVSRHEEHSQVRTADSELIGELASAHAGHDHVGQQEIDVLAGGLAVH